MAKTIEVVGIVVAIATAVAIGGLFLPQSSGQEEYDPSIDPDDFVSYVNNKFFTLTLGTSLVYESETDEGPERIEVFVTDEKKEVMGIGVFVVLDRVWLNDELIEETRDWYAQDKEGNVWYFGEDSKEYEVGELVGTKGSWEAGVNGAKPGIMMKASPQIGDSYRQEFYEGEAEDMADVLALDEPVTVPYGSFSGCLKTGDWTPLEPGAEGHKYYCPDVGGIALEIAIEDGQRVELIEIRTKSWRRPSTVTTTMIQLNTLTETITVTQQDTRPVLWTEVQTVTETVTQASQTTTTKTSTIRETSTVTTTASIQEGDEGAFPTGVTVGGIGGVIAGIVMFLLYLKRGSSSFLRSRKG